MHLRDYLRPGSHLTAVCSAHPLVLEAAVRHAVATSAPVLIEATCNQVNQDGGYTGLTPAQFRASLDALAVSCGLPPDRLLLGGDHLGPNPWTGLPAEDAMQRAETMVAAYIAAGFAKLHLDTSMPCADDPPSLAEPVIAARAARLAGIAEAEAARLGLPLPCYVVGTEVPPPGGALEHIDALAPTSPEAAARTIASHAEAFAALGLQAAMQRVIAIVVQPGVEFGTENLVDYAPRDPAALATVLRAHPGLVFEAHSTDYQTAASLAALVRDGFAILKVGPALTFALRETLYRLDAMATFLDPHRGPTLPDTMERLMTEAPQHWKGHYHGDALRLRVQRHTSYSDRIRYYWPHPDARQAVCRLLVTLDTASLPATLISQYLPEFNDRLRSGAVEPRPRDLLIAAIGDVLATYQRQ